MESDSKLAETLAAPPEGARAPSVPPQGARVPSVPSENLRIPGAPPVARGSTVERYLILDLLGEGGMGKVYAAYDPGLNRRVALKFLHARLARSVATEWRARLVREAQAMARLSHPNVVNVYDVGVADEHVFIAMELVDGGSVRRWLGKGERTWRQILAVFLEAGSGLAAAHRAGVVHRDFKPDNVLLGSDGRARVTDFGLARASNDPADTDPISSGPLSMPSDALSQPITEQLTGAGVFMGTPGYMAVEQWEHGPVDARTDVFSFCASLWEALYGELPFRSRDSRILQKALRSGKPREPKGDRQVPKWLRRVVQKGLAPLPENRYPSMAACLAALRADPAARWRRGIAVAVTGVVLATGASVVHARATARVRQCAAEGDAVGAVWSGARRAAMRRAFVATGQPFAPAAADAVARALDGYAGEWRASAVDACQATHVRGEQSDAMLELRRSCLDDRREELRALGDVLLGADGAVVEKSARATRALSPIAACDDLDRLSGAVRPPREPAARAEVHGLQGEVAAAKALFEAGKPLKSLERLRPLRERVTTAGYGPLLVAWTYWMGLAEGQVDEKAAVVDLERAIRLADEYRLDRERADAAIHLGKLEGSWAGRSDEAHRWLRLAEGMIARAGDPPDLAIRRDIDEGWAYQYEQRWSEAAPLFRRALSRLDATHIADPDQRAQAQSGLASTLQAQGNVVDALASEAAAVAEMERAYGPAHPVLGGYLNNLADAQLAAGATDDALATLTRVLAMGEARVTRGELSDHAPVLAWPNHTMGEVLMRLGRAPDAAAHFERAREIYKAAHGANNADVAYADYELSEAYRGAGRPVDAERALHEAEEIARTETVPDGVLAGLLLERARVALEHGDVARATVTATRALALREKESAPRELASARMVLARALAATDRARARDLAEKATDGLGAAHDPAGRDEAAALARALR